MVTFHSRLRDVAAARARGRHPRRVIQSTHERFAWSRGGSAAEHAGEHAGRGGADDPQLRRDLGGRASARIGQGRTIGQPRSCVVNVRRSLNAQDDSYRRPRVPEPVAPIVRIVGASVSPAVARAFPPPASSVRYFLNQTCRRVGWFENSEGATRDWTGVCRACCIQCKRSKRCHGPRTHCLCSFTRPKGLAWHVGPWSPSLSNNGKVDASFRVVHIGSGRGSQRVRKLPVSLSRATKPYVYVSIGMLALSFLKSTHQRQPLLR